MPRAVFITSGIGDVQGAGSGTLYGYSVRESAAAPAVATVFLRNGTSATDPIVASIELAANASNTVSLPAVDCPGGVFVDRTAGETELVLYVS